MDTVSPFLTLSEACDVARVGKSTLYRLHHRGVLPLRKIGRRTLVERSTLLSLIVPRGAAAEEEQLPQAERPKSLEGGAR